MTQSKTVIDTSVLEQQLGSDDDFLAEVVADYRTQRARISIQLRAATRAADWQEVHLLAHTLKGSLLVMGAKAASEAAFAVETLSRGNAADEIAEAVADLESELDRLELELDQLVRRGFRAS